MKRFLITGGTGFIGSAITKHLIAQKHLVRIFDNDFRGSITRIPNNSNAIEFIKADIRDYKKVESACKGIDSIIHLAYINGTENFYTKPDLVLSVGVKGIINILDGAKYHNVPQFLLASSSEVYQTPPSYPTKEDVPYFIPSPYNPRYSYAGGKIISELLTLYVGKPFLKQAIIFRPHNVYGPDMGNEHVIPEIINKITANQDQSSVLLPIQGTGKETRSFIFIDDFVDAIQILINKGTNGSIYNIGSNEEVSINQLVKKIAHIMHKKIIITHTPLQKGSTKRRCPDIEKITQLGFSIKIPLEKGLEKTILWYNQKKTYENKATY